MGLAGTSHVNYPEIRPSGSLRRNGKPHDYPPEVKRMVAKLYSCHDDSGCGFLYVGSL
jgi:hypothetical protein